MFHIPCKLVAVVEKELPAKTEHDTVVVAIHVADVSGDGNVCADIIPWQGVIQLK